MQLDSCFRSFPNPSSSTHPVCVVHSVCQSLLRLLLSKLPVSQLCLRFLNTLLIRSCREGLHHHDSESGRPASTAYPRGYIRPDPLSEDGIVFYGGGDVNVTCWTPRPASSMATPIWLGFPAPAYYAYNKYFYISRQILVDTTVDVQSLLK